MTIQEALRTGLAFKRPNHKKGFPAGAMKKTLRINHSNLERDLLANDWQVKLPGATDWLSDFNCEELPRYMLKLPPVSPPKGASISVRIMDGTVTIPTTDFYQWGVRIKLLEKELAEAREETQLRQTVLTSRNAELAATREELKQVRENYNYEKTMREQWEELVPRRNREIGECRDKLRLAEGNEAVARNLHASEQKVSAALREEVEGLKASGLRIASNNWQKDPAQFCRDVFGRELSPWQRRVLRDVVNNLPSEGTSARTMGENYGQRLCALKCLRCGEYYYVEGTHHCKPSVLLDNMQKAVSTAQLAADNAIKKACEVQNDFVYGVRERERALVKRVDLIEKAVIKLEQSHAMDLPTQLINKVDRFSQRLDYITDLSVKNAKKVDELGLRLERGAVTDNGLQRRIEALENK